MRNRLRHATLAAAAAALACTAGATPPRLDDATCQEMRLEKVKFIETGILADIARGPEWAKTNLSPEKLREIELFIMLDEQLMFGCRDAKISPDAARAGQAAIELEIPIAPAADPAAAAPAAKTPKAAEGQKPKRRKPKDAAAPVAPTPDSQNPPVAP
ncbi:MAG: hypothetical protein ACT4OU_10975 [Hyphomicrobium sp.]